VAITQAQYEARVIRLAAERGRTLDIADVSESLPMALQTVSQQIAGSLDYYLLQKIFTGVAIVSGTADLVTLTTMFRDTIERIEDNSNPVNVYSLLPPGAGKNDLDEPRNAFSYHAVIQGTKLYARGGDGSSFPPDANLSITANYAAIISEIPDPQYVDNLIEAGYQLCVAAQEAT
jgi:hypothetical protein